MNITAKKILSFSGGGCRGIYQAAYLREIAKSKNLKHPLWKNFDLIAGTSTGSIIALGVALEIEPNRIFDLFKNNIEKIFSPRILSPIRKGSRYDGELLRNVLTEVFTNRTLSDCKIPVIVPATTLDKFACRSFSTVDEKCEEGDHGLLVVDVIMASCAAPSYFSPVNALGEERTYVDGGFWANSPSLLAIMELHQIRKVDFNDMIVIAIGNGEIPLGEAGSNLKNFRPVSFSMINTVLNMVFSTQADMTERFVEGLLGKENVFTADSRLAEYIELDDAITALKRLPGIAEAAAKRDLGEIVSKVTRDSVSNTGGGGGDGGGKRGYQQQRIFPYIRPQ